MSPVQISMIRYGRPSAAIVRLGPADQLVEQRGRLLGRGEGQDLDLVELVRTQHAARVRPGRAGLAPVARRVRHEAHRQLRLVEDLTGVDRGERHLGGGDAPQVVTLDRERVVGELGELARRRERGRGTSEGGRISSKASALRSRASWQSARASVAPRPRCIVNIDPAIFVARSLSRMPSAAPVSQCGTRWCSGNASGRNGPLTTGLSCVGRAVGGGVLGRLGMHEQLLAERVVDLVVLDCERLLALADAPALGLERLGLVGVAVAAQLADLLRQVVDLARAANRARWRCRAAGRRAGAPARATRAAPACRAGRAPRGRSRSRCASAGRRSHERG